MAIEIPPIKLQEWKTPAAYDGRQSGYAEVVTTYRPPPTAKSTGNKKPHRQTPSGDKNRFHDNGKITHLIGSPYTTKAQKSRKTKQIQRFMQVQSMRRPWTP
jgi:hypothetical protein